MTEKVPGEQMQTQESLHSNHAFSTLGKAVKTAFSEYLLKWWFLIAIFAPLILALLYGGAGSIAAQFRALRSLTKYISASAFFNVYMKQFGFYNFGATGFSIKPIVLWITQKAIVTFLLFEFMFLFAGYIPARLSNDKRHMRLTQKTALLFFVATIIVAILNTIVSAHFESLLSQNTTQQAQKYFNTLMSSYSLIFNSLLLPFTISSYLMLSIFSLIKRNGFTGKTVSRIILFEFILAALNIAISLPFYAQALSKYVLFSIALIYIAWFILTFVPPAIAEGANIREAFSRGLLFLKTHIGDTLLLYIATVIVFYYLIAAIPSVLYAIVYKNSITGPRGIFSFIPMLIGITIYSFGGVALTVSAYIFYRMENEKQAQENEVENTTENAQLETGYGQAE